MDKTNAANEKFVASRHVDALTQRRDEAVQELLTAETKYRELCGDISHGEEFYGTLTDVVAQLKQSVSDHKYSRGIEAKELLMHMKKPTMSQPVAYNASAPSAPSRGSSKESYPSVNVVAPPRAVAIDPSLAAQMAQMQMMGFTDIEAN